MKALALFFSLFILPLASQAIKALPRTPSPEGAKVFFISPEDGARLKNPVHLKFGISGMEIAPAGTRQVNSGHHHLLIDTQIRDYGFPIGNSPQHLHFGKGQTEASINLSPGRHTLQLILGDHLHIPHDPPVKSPVITIFVED